MQEKGEAEAEQASDQYIMESGKAEVGIQPQKKKQLPKGEAWEKEKQRQKTQKNQQTMKSGKAEVGTQ